MSTCSSARRTDVPWSGPKGAGGVWTSRTQGPAPVIFSRLMAGRDGLTRAQAGSRRGSTARRSSSTRRAFRWSDAGWHGYELAAAVIYELHVGTFSHEVPSTGPSSTCSTL